MLLFAGSKRSGRGATTAHVKITPTGRIELNEKAMSAMGWNVPMHIAIAGNDESMFLIPADMVGDGATTYQLTRVTRKNTSTGERENTDWVGASATTAVRAVLGSKPETTLMTPVRKMTMDEAQLLVDETGAVVAPENVLAADVFIGEKAEEAE